jgi:hypothetical protein
VNHDPESVRWFKARARSLLESYKDGDEPTRRFFHYWNKTGPAGLQKMQHALARSTGYRSWHALLAATEKTRQESIRILKASER